MSERKRIGLREVRALGAGKSIWDRRCRASPRGARRATAVTYLVKYRTADGRQRWHVIGRHGSPWTPEAARDKARGLLGEVVKGADPAAESGGAQGDDGRRALRCLSCRRRSRAVLTRRKQAKKSSTLATRQGPDRASHQAALGPPRGRRRGPATMSSDLCTT